jgi:hypothetical protein
MIVQPAAADQGCWHTLLMFVERTAAEQMVIDRTVYTMNWGRDAA